ncbi:hypothetical protein WICPIJ_009957 [Wickerhamomyces pijperi]|uniref:Uncharacterized protein n=1 Tax=Wickerhamomyces pijperi TaxID=599730 RepID=A0A9P8PK40_WICPI|nr:hypothetical protein WICPIJ_009957 [Wickerhamomyces pijperi]
MMDPMSESMSWSWSWSSSVFETYSAAVLSPITPSSKSECLITVVFKPAVVSLELTLWETSLTINPGLKLLNLMFALYKERINPGSILV